MNKSKELARELKESYKAGDLHIISVLKLIETVLSETDEPDPLKGWIEDSTTKGFRRLIHLYHDVVYVEDSENTVMRYFEEGQIECSITFDQLKAIIVRAG